MRRHIVIGDIHGCHAELLDLLDVAGVTGDDRIVSVGDLVDRGPESPEVLNFFRTQPNAVALMGNHERKHVRNVLSYSQEIVQVQMGADHADAVQWMSGLPYFLELDEAIVVHAAVAPGVPLLQQKDEILCGTTSGEKQLQALTGGRWWHELYDGDKPVLYGHHVVGDQPLIRADGKVYGLDTGACHGGRLTAVSVPDFKIYSVPAREDHWSRVKRLWQVRVLAAQPWLEKNWKEVDAGIREHRQSDHEGTRAYAEALQAWRDQMDRLSEHLFAYLQAEAGRLEQEAGEASPRDLAKEHPCSRFLFQCFRRKLTLDTLRTQCFSPKALIEAAGAAGLQAPALPAAS